MTRLSLERFQALCIGLRLKPSQQLHAKLLSCYRESHRAYHTEQHLKECLRHLDGANGECQNPATIELALWFHDAIYKPRASDNEQRSALLARREVLESGGEVTLAAEVEKLILYTPHDSPPPLEGDAAVLVDIDLAILGAHEERYWEYEQQVRQEYRWVPTLVFRRKRIEVLDAFAQRSRIYATPTFFGTYEQRARQNLRGAIARLRS